MMSNMTKLQETLNGLPYGGQSRLARQIGVTAQTINKWARGTTYPSRANLQTLAAALDLPVDSLITRADSLSAVKSARAGRVVALSETLQRDIHRISSDLPGIIARSDLDDTDRSIIALAVGKMAESADELNKVLRQLLEHLEHDV